MANTGVNSLGSSGVDALGEPAPDDDAAGSFSVAPDRLLAPRELPPL